MTNFERIKSMNVDELVETLRNAADNVCYEKCKKLTGNRFKYPIGEEIEISDCQNCIKKWLESECECDE